MDLNAKDFMLFTQKFFFFSFLDLLYTGLRCVRQKCSDVGCVGGGGKGKAKQFDVSILSDREFHFSTVLR